jgi:hypothetical protein
MSCIANDEKKWPVEEVAPRIGSSYRGIGISQRLCMNQSSVPALSDGRLKVRPADSWRGCLSDRRFERKTELHVRGSSHDTIFT